MPETAKAPPGYTIVGEDGKSQSPVSRTPLFLPPPGYSIQSPTGEENAQMMTDATKQVAPYVGRFAANSLPMAGGMIAGIPGAAVGSGLKMGAQALAPGAFGQPPQDPIDFAKTLGVDLTTQGLIPAGIEKLAGSTGSWLASRALRNFPAVREGAAKEMTSQIMKGMEPNSQVLEGAAQEAKGLFDNLRGEYEVHLANTGGDTAHPFVKQAADNLKDAFGKNSVGRSLVKLQREFEKGGDVAKSQTYQSIADMALSDLTHVRNWKLVTDPEAVASLASNKLLTNGFREGKGAIDATKILGELDGKSAEVYKEALGNSYTTFREALDEIKSQQVGHDVSDRILSYTKGHLIWTAPLILSGHSLLSGIGGVAAGTVLTNSLLAKAMANPETAKLVVAALRTSRTAPQADMIHKALMGAIRGSLDFATTPEK